MALSRRQQILYTHRVDLYEPLNHPATGGVVGGQTFRLYAANVPCYAEATPNLDEPTTAGEVRTDMIFTTDRFHFAEDQEIGAGWRIVSRTLNADGTPYQDYGMVWATRGDPQPTPKLGRRDAGKKMIMASLDPKPPSSVLS